MAEQDLFLSFMLQHVTDYKMVAVGNDTNGTILYQKVGAGSIPPHTHTPLKGKVLVSVFT